MPPLDHFHPPLAPGRTWESFQIHWASTIAHRLNRSLLPEGYFAVEHARLGPTIEMDVATAGNVVSAGGDTDFVVVGVPSGEPARRDRPAAGPCRSLRVACRDRPLRHSIPADRPGRRRAHRDVVVAAGGRRTPPGCAAGTERRARPADRSGSELRGRVPASSAGLERRRLRLLTAEHRIPDEPEAQASAFPVETAIYSLALRAGMRHPNIRRSQSEGEER